LTTTDYFSATNKKGDFIEQLILTKARHEYYRLNPADILTKAYKKIVNKKIKRHEFFKKTDLYLINVNNIESILKTEIETCPEVDAIEREMMEEELLRDLAYIDNYLEQERNEIHQPINETLQEINETQSVNNESLQVINETQPENNSKSPDLKRKNIFERGINKFFKRKKNNLKSN
jgi:hypothetical protein